MDKVFWSYVAPMRIYYPEEFRKIVANHDLIIVDHWGGYAGEKYGQGSELVLKFRDKLADKPFERNETAGAIPSPQL